MAGIVSLKSIVLRKIFSSIEKKIILKIHVRFIHFLRNWIDLCGDTSYTLNYETSLVRLTAPPQIVKANF